MFSDQLCSGMRKAFTLENQNMSYTALIVRKTVQFKRYKHVGVRHLLEIGNCSYSPQKHSHTHAQSGIYNAKVTFKTSEN